MGHERDRQKGGSAGATSRLIDAEFQFSGWRANQGQALQWPGVACPDPDGSAWTFLVLVLRTSNYVDSNVVPKALLASTCEMARELMIADRTAAPAGEGVLSTTTGAGASFNSIRYNKPDARPGISHVAQAMLAKFGSLVKGGSGAVRLVRG